MLNKYKYKDKLRYHFRDTKKVILSWYPDDKKSEKNKEYRRWINNIIIKKKNIDNVIYKSACTRYNILKEKTKLKKKKKDWNYNVKPIYRKQPFLTSVEKRDIIIKNIIESIEKKDSLYYIKNSLYHLLEKNTDIKKNLNILNFNWFLKKENKLVLSIEENEVFFKLGLKRWYYGFLIKGFKQKSENNFLYLLKMLKIYLKKKRLSGLQIVFYFLNKIKPLVGFRRRRLGRNNAKGKDIRYIYQVYNHTIRWQTLIIKNLLFNSPFYKKKARRVKVRDMFNGLINVLDNKGPIVKGLISYYKLIGQRTPFAIRKKKKKKKLKMKRIKKLKNKN